MMHSKPHSLVGNRFCMILILRGINLLDETRQIIIRAANKDANKEACMCCRAPYYLIIALMLSSTICAAQVAPPLAGATSPDTEDAPRAAFIELSKYMRGNPLDFNTSFVSQNTVLGTSRGSAHFVIDRPNCFGSKSQLRNFLIRSFRTDTCLRFMIKPRGSMRR